MTAVGFAEDVAVADMAGQPVGLRETRETIGDILEATRLARHLAGDAGAAFHGLFLIPNAAASGPPLVCFDNEFPRVSENSRRIRRAWIGNDRRPAVGSVSPLWWSGDPVDVTPRSAPCSCCECSPPLIAGLPGVLLPLFSEAGASGFAVFAGHGLQLDDAKLCELHLRCFAIFSVVAPIRAGQEEGYGLLSARELQCLKMTADGRTSEEIGRALGLSQHTANQYLATAAQKLNAVSRIHAAAKALRLALIE